jgi:two-component system response regulator YesN
MPKEYTSVVIVDDDETIRESLRQNTDWEGHGYQIAGTAYDGISGLELIEEVQPDVIISDILMPSMDGLDMLKELRSRGYHQRIIILSGHEEFEYARKAIRLSVDAYLNKPIDNDILFETLNMTKEKLENERLFSARIKDSLPLLRQAFMARLFSGYYKDMETIREQCEVLELSFGGGPFFCVAVRLDPLSEAIKKRNFLGREFLKGSISKFFMDRLKEKFSVWIHDLEETCFVLLLTPGAAGDYENQNILAEKLEELISFTKSQYKIPLAVGLSDPHKDILHVANSYQEALKALSCDHIFGTGRIISIRDLCLQDNGNTYETQKIAKDLSIAVRVADASMVSGQLSRFNSQVRSEPHISMIRIRMDASTMAFALINEADSWLKQDGLEAHKAFNEAYGKIQTLGTVEDILEAVKDLAYKIIGLIEATRGFHHETVIHKALAYIETNYQDTSLSLKKTANAVGVSQSHLSFLFNKKINSSFHKCVTRIRIEHAITLLRGENDFKTYEIADLAGYSNAQYFSVSFKKYTGLTPLQFRNESISMEVTK